MLARTQDGDNYTGTRKSISFADCWAALSVVELGSPIPPFALGNSRQRIRGYEKWMFPCENIPYPGSAQHAIVTHIWWARAVNMRGLILGPDFSAVHVLPIQFPTVVTQWPLGAGQCLWVLCTDVHTGMSALFASHGVPACASWAERTCCRAAANALTFPSAVSDCFWEDNLPPLCGYFWLPSHTLTHKHTLLTFPGHLISARQFMGHSESEDLTDFSFSTLLS